MNRTGARKGHFVSAETKEKIRKANTGKVMSDWVKKKISLAKKGKHPSPATEFKKGMIQPPKSLLTRLKTSIALTGRKFSEERKLKNKSVWFKKGQTPWNKGTKGLSKRNRTTFTTENVAKEKHPLWKGDGVGYYALHEYMLRNFNWAKECEHCGSTKRLQLASRDYSYRREKGAWIVLCQTCHFRYDRRNNKWGFMTEKFNL